MATPLSIPAAPVSVPSLWRAIAQLPLVRRLLGTAEEKSVVASAIDEVDTSLTQAHLEVLK
jgi:hypothetical protein